MRKVLISGGLGFIGRHLVRHLLSRPNPYQVTVVDDLSGSDLSAKSIASLQKSADIKVMDFLDYAYTGENFDDIYHLASPVGAIGILAKSGKIAKQILDLADKATEIALLSSSRLMYISSSEIYYSSPNQQEESDILLTIHAGARIEYAMGKYAGEVAVRNMGIAKKLEYNICRPFNLIGEEQSSKLGFVVPRFMEACLIHADLKVFGDGTQERSFCDINDFIPALVQFQEGKITYETLNIGNLHNRTTILNLAQTIKNITGSPSKIRCIDPVSKYGSLYMEGGEKLANVEKANRLIHLNLTPNLIEVLKRIHQSYKMPH